MIKITVMNSVSVAQPLDRLSVHVLSVFQERACLANFFSNVNTFAVPKLLFSRGCIKRLEKVLQDEGHLLQNLLVEEVVGGG